MVGLREGLQRVLDEYRVASHDPLTHHPLAAMVTQELPSAVAHALGDEGVDGSGPGLCGAVLELPPHGASFWLRR